MHLYQVLAERVAAWRAAHYHHEAYPTIAEILEWAADPDGAGFRLRLPQVRALETYWYLRLALGTPHVRDLYARLFPDVNARLEALGVSAQAFADAGYQLDRLWDRIETDDEFVRVHRFQALRETLTLAYPSYILALAMGAGKTVLIGAVFATEFAMSLEYPDGPFVENALVFAPGKTIIESLRELAEVRYNRILPPRLHKAYAASVKLTFTRDGERDIPVIAGSAYNVVVTSTEKIRIQKESIRKGDLGPLFSAAQEDEAKAEVANLRLQKIASLPNLAIFSDEAHHTYGRALDTELKKVRKTVDYLAQQTSVLCVINTTGTPYYSKQPLRDVVVWYGLSEGIRDGILKGVQGNIRAFEFESDRADRLVDYVVRDFFSDYGDVCLPNGAPARLALYFPQTDDLEELRPAVEAALADLGYPPTIVLRNTNDSPQSEVDAFNRLQHDPAAPHRVILLVNKGTEGWNCPSLFACALVRKLRSSNNFVLQAASRCLRQVPGNPHRARIYLAMENRAVLDRQLQETYGETIADLDHAQAQRASCRIVLRKVDLPPLVVRQVVRTVVPRDGVSSDLTLQRPVDDAGSQVQGVVYDLADQSASYSVLRQVDSIAIDALPDTVDLYAAAVDLAATYRLDPWRVYDELVRLYPGERAVPAAHLEELASQVEEQTRNYRVQEEMVEKALALVCPHGFDETLQPDGTVAYTAEITYPIDKERLLLHWRAGRYPHDLGFHYSPYNFDSNPEHDFCDQLLAHLGTHPHEVEDVYFTGAITDPAKTDFYVEYLGEDGRPHRYTPDFIVRRTDGRCLIVEIKSAQFRAATEHDLERYGTGDAALTVEGRKAVALKRWEALNPGRIRYEIVFAATEAVAWNQWDAVRAFAEEPHHD